MWVTNAETVNIWTKLEDGTYVYLDTINTRRTMTKQPEKLDIREALRKYAQKELDFYKNAEKNKLYHRVLPNMKDKSKGMIDFYYNGIIVGGYLDAKANTVVLNKLKVTKFGKEEEVPTAISLIEDKFKETEMVCDNQLK